MENSPLVSIALCTYNGEKFLGQLLDTLINQTYPNIEIIAVDDCSTDNTYAILTTYAVKYPQITVYKNEVNLGFVRNFEHALTYCQGDLIAFCDQDDLWLPEKIALQVEGIGDNMLIYHDSEFINDQEKPLGKKMSDIVNFYKGDDPRVFLFFSCVSGHAMLVKKQLLAEALPFKEGYYHDWWLAYVATNIGSITFIPQCLVKYRQHNNSKTDLLEIKVVENDSFRNQANDQVYKTQAKWLEHCANYPKNRYPAFVKKLYYLYNNRTNNYLSIRLLNFMKGNIDILYYNLKRSDFEKLKAVSRHVWGYKTRNFWYTYVKPNEKKIVRPNGNKYSAT
jgi:glycosyltransferase involved in cell wall biosynthesis